MTHQEQVPRKQGLKLYLDGILDRNPNMHQEQVPRKQGLKLQICTLRIRRHRHQEQVPRKQGLKHPDIAKYAAVQESSRASSTKTRIETKNRGSADRTVAQHQEQVPRKQGLKLDVPALFASSEPVHQEQVPRKQGLKQEVNSELPEEGDY